eukprot:3804784-Pyramimonas_sp.AAC.1
MGPRGNSQGGLVGYINSARRLRQPLWQSSAMARVSSVAGRWGAGARVESILRLTCQLKTAGRWGSRGFPRASASFALLG